MAYDLFHRRQTPRTWARESLPAIPKRPLLFGLGFVGFIHLLPSIVKMGERQYYRHKLADDWADTTQTMPAISMYELTGAKPRKKAA
jgi:hypothetical protein